MLTWIRNILHSASGADNWQRWWDARVAALEAVLGPCDGTVYHSPPPLHLDGYADVLRFRQFVEGVTYVTCDLIGNPRHVPNDTGSYELMMCTRDDNKWAPAVLSRLAKYTHDAASVLFRGTAWARSIVSPRCTAASWVYLASRLRTAGAHLLSSRVHIISS
jgi:hypothetical protein